jgi:hypothetical protein
MIMRLIHTHVVVVLSQVRAEADERSFMTDRVCFPLSVVYIPTRTLLRCLST